MIHICLIKTNHNRHFPEQEWVLTMNTIEQIHRTAIAPLDTAHSLPFAAYRDQAVYEAEKAHIFTKEWIFVCMDKELPNPGDYYAMTLADEPIVIMRGDDLQLRALSNICRHRGTPILDSGFGTVDKYITCPYHAWAYDKVGALQAIPYNNLIAVDRSDHQLPNYRVELWNQLVFVNLDPNAPALQDRLSPIAPYIKLFDANSFDQVNQGGIEEWNANWKLAMENAMESYHLFQVHDATLEPFSPTRDAYYIAGCSEWSLTGGATARKKGLLEKLVSRSYNELYEHYVLVSLPPSFVGIVSYGSFAWLSAHPMGTDKVQIRSGATFHGDAFDNSSQSAEFTRAFFAEDQAICERVQQGMRATQTKGGKLVDMERVVVDFHQFLGTRLAKLPPTTLFEDDAAATWKQAT